MSKIKCQLVKNGLDNFFAYLANDDQVNIESRDDYCWITNEFGVFPNNYVYDLKSSVTEKMDELKENILNKRMGDLLWIPGTAENEELIDTLEENDFEKAIEYKGMYLDLEELEDEAQTDIEIKEVDSQDLLYQWAKVIVEGWWSGTKAKIDSLYQMYRNFYQDTENFRVYVALIDGKVVGSAMAYFGEEVVGLYLISTLPEYRKRGIGRELTTRPLRDAREKGCTGAVLQATKEGEKLYSKIGFEEVFNYQIYFLSEEK